MKKKVLSILVISVLLLLASFSAFAVSESEAIAKIGDDYYATLDEAIAAVPADGTQTTVTLLKDAVGNGVVVKEGQNVIIDLGGFTYTLSDENNLVGSPGTVTLFMQLRKDADVTLKNGTLTSTKAKMLVQNYSDLKLEDITLDGTKSDVCLYTLSNNFGSVVITGDTHIIGDEDTVAFDVWYGMFDVYDEGVTVTFDQEFTGSVTGKIEYGAADRAADGWQEKAALIIDRNADNSANFDVEFAASSEEDIKDANIVISGGRFTCEIPEEFCADGYVPCTYEDGTYGVCKHSFTSYHSDRNSTFFKNGTRTAKCDNGCMATDTVEEADSKLTLGTVTKISATQSTSVIKLTWNKIDGATGYRVYQYSPSKKTYVLKASVKGTTSYRVTGLTSAKEYKFKLLPYVKDTDGTVLWGTESKVFVSATEPKAPAKITATQSDSVVKLTWSKSSGATGYRVYQYSPSKKTYVLKASLKGTTSYRRTGLKAGTAYKFKITPYIKLSDGTAVFGESKAINTATEPKAPSRITYEKSTTTVDLTWSKSSGATGYRVYQYNASKGTFVKIASVKGTTNYWVKGLKANTSYKFRVEPYIKLSNGTVIEGAVSKTVTVTTDKAYAKYSDINNFVDIGKYLGISYIKKDTVYESGMKITTYYYDRSKVISALNNGKNLGLAVYESKTYQYYNTLEEDRALFTYYYYPSKDVMVMFGDFYMDGVFSVSGITEA